MVTHDMAFVKKLYMRAQMDSENTLLGHAENENKKMVPAPTATWLLYGVQAQYSMGNTGLLNIPTADMQKAGTFMGGGNYLPNGMTPFNFNTGNYFVNITFLSFLELSYRCTLLKTTRYDGKKGYFQQDRSLSARIRPIEEGKYHPAIVIGTNDPFKDTGTNYFATIYGVLTKGFSIAKETD